MSLGAVSNQRRQNAYNEAVAYANSKNTIVVVAAGNSNENAAGYSPANSKGVIAVSAVDEDLSKASFSNTIQDLEYGIAAPGVNIFSTMPKNKYASLSGTSMAAPHVAGLIALMKSFEPSINTAEAFEILNKTGLPTSSKQLTGKLIQSDKALKQLLK
jgi:thermitase